jgi:transcriptional regulator GlxA family with amidase domain
VRRVLFALLPKTVLLDVAGPAEAFRIANRAAPGSYELSFASSTRTVESAIGLQLAALEPLPKRVADGTVIVVTGVTGDVDFTSPAVQKLSEWLRVAMKNETATLMCVCAGSIVAAHAGLLNHHECTTHHSCVQQLREIEPHAQVHENRIFVEDGRVFTSAGVTAGIDLSLHLIGQQLGHQVAAAVARELVVYMRRSGSDPALSPWVMHRNHIHPIVHRVQDAVSRDPAADWSAERLAGIGHTSMRNLTRLFAQHARCSPLDYVQRMRIAVARELLAQSGMPLERVAEQSGFTSAHQLRRVWRRWETAPPSSMRRSPKMAPTSASN